MTALEGDDRPLSAPRSVTSYSSILFYYADSEIRYFNLLPLKGMDPCHGAAQWCTVVARRRTPVP